MFMNLDKLIFHESRDYFCSPIMKKNSFGHDSRQLKTGVHCSRKTPFPTLRIELNYASKKIQILGENGINYAQKSS